MDDSNKIDLKEVNKTKKSFKFPQLKNPFKKQDGPKRDDEGKFAVKSGGGGLSAAKNLDLKRALPLILVISLVGGFLVFKSFAGGSQATVASWYRTCSNREPDAGGLAYWAGRLDKGEATWTVADAFMKSAGVASCNYPDAPKTIASPKLPAVPVTTAATPTATSSTNSANQATVTSFYTACKYSSVPATASESFRYWENLVANSSASSVWPKFRDQSRVNGRTCPDAMPGAAATTPGATASNPLNDAKAWSALGAAHVANAKKENEASYKISLKNLVERKDLSTIAQKEGYVRGALAQMQSGKGKVQGLYNQAISNAATKSQGPEILSEVNVVQGHINMLIGYIKNISSDYKRAEATYEANLNFYQKLGDSQREAADCISRGGTPRFTGGCNEPTVPAKTVLGGTAGPAPGASGATTQAPIPTWLTARQDQLDFAKGHCEKQPNKHKTVNIPGGYRIESYDVYYKKGSLECSEKYTHTISTHCGDGWSKDGARCVNAYAQAVEKAKTECNNGGSKRWYDNRCMSVYTDPTNAKCKSTAPFWEWSWKIGFEYGVFQAFSCSQGLKSRDCPRPYIATSKDHSLKRWHFCRLP